MYHFTVVTTDGNGGDVRTETVEASGIGEAGQMAYGIAEEEDRHCIGVVETEDVAAVRLALPFS